MSHITPAHKSPRRTALPSPPATLRASPGRLGRAVLRENPPCRGKKSQAGKPDLRRRASHFRVAVIPSRKYFCPLATPNPFRRIETNLWPSVVWSQLRRRCHGKGGAEV